MKKISYLLTAALLLLGFTSCEDDKDPVVTVPESFVLNTPAMANQFYQLANGNYTEFTCSQPDYGFVASVTYGIEISFDQKEFATIAPKTATSTVIRLADNDIAIAMCELRGIFVEEDWTQPGPQPLYVRATAQLGSHDNTLVKSNWIELKQVEGYFAVRKPGVIYLVGVPNGWLDPKESNEEAYAEWALSEKDDAIDSKIYYGCFDIAADAFMLRFYTELTDWNGGASLGHTAGEDTTTWDWATVNEDGTVIESMTKGKGNYHFENWPGGLCTIVVDLSKKNAYTVTFMEGNQL